MWLKFGKDWLWIFSKKVQYRIKNIVSKRIKIFTGKEGFIARNIGAEQPQLDVSVSTVNESSDIKLGVTIDRTKTTKSFMFSGEGSVEEVTDNKKE